MNRQFDHEELEVYQASLALRLWSIVSMLVALIKANSDYRLHDGSPE